MKKLILSIIALALGMSICSAQASYGIFQVNDGICTIQKTVAASQAPAVWWMKTKLAVFNSLNSNNVLEDNTNVHIKIACNKNVKSAYNPFAGSFTSDLSFTLTIDAVPGGAEYRIADLMVKESYAGYGMKSTIYDLAERICTFESKKAELENLKSIPGKLTKDQKKAIKDLEDEIEDIDEVLVRCDSELSEIIRKIETAIAE